MSEKIRIRKALHKRQPSFFRGFPRIFSKNLREVLA